VPAGLALPAFRLLAGLKRLRGGAFDLFGWQADRKLERTLIGEYRALIRGVAETVTSATLHTAIELAAAPELVAGYGPVKEAGVEAFRARVAELLPKLDERSDVSTVPEKVTA
jgi:indolepyruvate ferredoxin oxidoreductase